MLVGGGERAAKEVQRRGLGNPRYPKAPFPTANRGGFVMSRRNLPLGKALTEDSKPPSIYRRPARAAFGRGPGGEPPLREGESDKAPPRIAASKTPHPVGL